MNIESHKPTILVLGGRGYIGRHIVKQLNVRGARVLIGTRNQPDKCNKNERCIRLHEIDGSQGWAKLLHKVDVVINAVGILRQRHRESYEKVHHTAVADLAEACQRNHTRLIHLSALGLKNNPKSRFLISKHRGETALKNSGADWAIVRPSVVDGRGGFGAKWFRRLARWPIHFSPAHAKKKIAPIDVRDLGEAIAQLAMANTFGDNDCEREYELGGMDTFSLFEYLNILAPQKPWLRVTVPTLLARIVAHLCDLLHTTPYSYGHHDLLKHDNLPQHNRLPELLGRPPRQIGYCVQTQRYDYQTRQLR